MKHNYPKYLLTLDEVFGERDYDLCTFKKGNVVRIISARLATEPEKARYEYGESYNE